MSERPSGDLAPEITASEHIAETTVGPEVAARINPAEQAYLLAEPEQLRGTFSAEFLARIGDRPVLWSTGDPTLDAALRAVHVGDAWDALDRDVDELVHTFGEVITPPAERLAAFEELAASVNDRIRMGQIVPPADLLTLRHLAGGALRRMEDGSYHPNMAPEAFDDFSALYGLVNDLRSLASRVEIGSAPAGAGDVVVVRGGHLEVPESFTAETQVSPASPAIEEAAARIADRGAHVVMTSENRPLADAVVRAHGGATAGDGVRVIELNAPDAVVALARAEQERMARAARVNELQARASELEGQVGKSTERLVNWLPEGELRDLWSRYMNAEPGSFAAWMSEPTSVGAIVDAMESIERGVFGNLTDVEAQTLHDALWRMAEDVLAANSKVETVAGTAGKAAPKMAAPAARVSRRIRSKVDWNPANAADDLERLATRVAQVVEHRDDLPPLAEYTGTQYEFGLPPTKAKIGGGPLPPRLFFRDFISEADALVPGLVDELLSKRQMTWGARLAATHSEGLLNFIGRSYDAAFGARPEQAIRANTLLNFERELAGPAYDVMTRDQYQAFREDVGAIYRAWRTDQEQHTIGPWGFPIYRRIGLMSPRMLEQKAVATLQERHAGQTPWWYGQGKTAADAWAAADNRLRLWIRGHTAGDVGRYVDTMYDRGPTRYLANKARGITVLYHVFRFAADLRWVAMEFVEGPMLAFGRSGPAGVLNAYRPARAPLLWGRAELMRTQEAWAHWLSVTDPGGIMSIRNRFLLGSMKAEQPERLLGTLRTMAANDKELAQTLRLMGDTPEQWLARLDRDYQFMMTRTKTLAPAEARAVYEPFLRDGVITQGQFDSLVASGRYTSIPELERAVAESAGDPRLQLMMRTLQVKNQELWNELAGVFFGQPDRSNLQRLMNHPLLYWPISYQLKATKWLANIMFDRAFGLDTGAAGAWTIQQVHDEHMQRMATDPAYAKSFADNQTLLFMAQMFVPITPFDIGVSLSPWTRMVMEQAYSRIDPSFADPYARNAFGVGPGYTYFELLPRLIYEQQKPGGLLYGNPLVETVAPTFPFKSTVEPPRVTRSQLQAANLATEGTAPVTIGPLEEPQGRYGY